MSDDPRENVPEALDDRLDSLSASLTDDDIRTTAASPGGLDGDADTGDSDGGDAGSDADDTDADADDSDA